MLVKKGKRLLYRAARKILVVNKSCFFVGATNELVAALVSDAVSYEVVSFERLESLENNSGEMIAVELADRLKGDSTFCVAAIHNNSMVAFAWLALGEIAAEQNHDGHPQTGLPISLGPDSGFLFNVFVSPEFRGKGFYSIMVSHLAKHIQPLGIKQILVSTEFSNRKALRSVEKMRFQYVGSSRLIRVGPFAFASYPPNPICEDIQLGRYIGDQRG